MVIYDDKPLGLLYPTSITRTSSQGLKIKGRVSEKGMKIPCRVRLFDRSSSVLVADIETNKDGAYVFDNLSTECKYFVVAHHPLNQFNAVISDNLVPK